MKGVAIFFAFVGLVLLGLVKNKGITLTEAVTVFIVLLLLFAAYALGRWWGRNEAKGELAGEEIALQLKRMSLWAESESSRVELESGMRENEDAAKKLKQKERDLGKQRAELRQKERIAEKSAEQRHESVREMEREIKRADEERRAALEEEKRKFQSHQESMRQQHNFLRNYFLRRGRIDAYVGQDALRKCGGVYVISRRDGLVKVGITEADFSRRFVEVQRDCARAGIRDIAPEILVPMDEGIAAVEAEVHKKFSAQREGGEWFRVSTEDAMNAVLSAAWRQHLRNTQRRKYINPPNKGDDEARGGPRHSGG